MPLTLIDPLTLALPALPQGLEGLRLLHVSDLHVRKPRKRHDLLLDEMRDCPHDLLLITGDIMHGPGHESAAIDLLGRILQTAHPRLGTFGCFGNHDTPAFKALAADLPIRWLNDAAWISPDLPLNILGLAANQQRISGDLVSALCDEVTQCPAGGPDRLRILLSHLPVWFPPAAEAGIHLTLAGHTHGGQCRLPGRRVLYNGTDDWPLALTTGVLRLRQSTAVLSRGLGESNVEYLRLLCKPHAPLITLQRDDTPPPPADKPVVAVAW